MPEPIAKQDLGLTASPSPSPCLSPRSPRVEENELRFKRIFGPDGVPPTPNPWKDRRERANESPGPNIAEFLAAFDSQWQLRATQLQDSTFTSYANAVMMCNAGCRENRPGKCDSMAYFFFPADFGTAAAAFAFALALAFWDRSEVRRAGFGGFDSFGRIGLSESRRHKSVN
eukprot:s3347_g22.t1